MNAYSNLTENDKELILSYIDDYAGDQEYISVPRAPLNTLLKAWDEAKSEYLFSLMGGELILSKKIEYSLAAEELETNIVDKLLYNKKVEKFIHELKSIPHNHDWQFSADGLYCNAERALNHLFDSWVLANNAVLRTYQFPMPNDKILQIQEGSKPVKIIGKIAEAYGIEGFEDFRIIHSQIFNQKKLSGELCLSIHPMDYMTMSDNDCDWSSCMSWRENGGYRSGTLGMMNSSSVIVTYLKSSEDMRFYDHTWNNKKWRNLIIATPEFISSVKGYPYQNDELITTAIKWVAELGRNNLNWDIPGEVIKYKHCTTFNTHNNHPVKLRFKTQGWMYNDFGSIEHHCAFCNEPSQTEYTFIYEGVPTCMNCGREAGWSEEEQLLCDNCYNADYCECCGQRIVGNYFYVDDEMYCESCYYNYTEECAILQDRFHESELIELKLSRINNGTLSQDDKYCCKSITIYENLYTDYFNIWNEYFTHEPRLHSIKYQWWTDTTNYVCVDDCTPKGLALFGLDSEEEVKDYLCNKQEAEKEE